MNKKTTTIIILLIILIILTPIVFHYYTEYKQEQERIGFKNAIISASTIENQSDIKMHQVNDGVRGYTDEIGAFFEEDIVTLNDEINILKDFNKTTSNETQIQYIDLQVKRLEGEIATYSQIIADRSTTSEVVMGYNQGVHDTKTEVMGFLAGHPDLRQCLEDWGIDEDFVIEQVERF